MTAAPPKIILVKKPGNHGSFLPQIARSEHSGADAATSRGAAARQGPRSGPDPSRSAQAARAAQAARDSRGGLTVTAASVLDELPRIIAFRVMAAELCACTDAEADAV
jgi:hypothetical protein